jgi:hypothetical protein
VAEREDDPTWRGTESLSYASECASSIASFSLSASFRISDASTASPFGESSHYSFSALYAFRIFLPFLSRSSTSLMSIPLLPRLSAMIDEGIT